MSLAQFDLETLRLNPQLPIYANDMSNPCEVIIDEQTIEQIILIPAGPVATNEKYNPFVPTLGQTIFTLSGIPTIPNLSKVFVNGQSQLFIRDYSISGTQLFYLNTLYLLDSDDDLEIYFI